MKNFRYLFLSLLIILGFHVILGIYFFRITKKKSNYPKLSQNFSLNTKPSQMFNPPKRPVVLLFPLSVELDILHFKLSLLSEVVDKFVFIETNYTEQGNMKPLYFNECKNEERWSKYLPQIVHLMDEFNPSAQGRALGWWTLDNVRRHLGEWILEYNASHGEDDAVMIFSDADEIPSVEGIEWLRQHCCEKRVTYEFASTMPQYIYSFNWLARKSGYSTATARSVRDEAEFRVCVKTQAIYKQRVISIGVSPSGYHCSYCMSSEMCVLKLAYTNLVDGPPFLGEQVWTIEKFDWLRACGITPQGNALYSTDIPVKVRSEWTPYLYLFYPDNVTYAKCRN